MIKVLPLPSAKRTSFLIELSREKEKNIFFSIYLRVKKKDVLLHPLIERDAIQKKNDTFIDILN
jgi:hypothetical protein